MRTTSVIIFVASILAPFASAALHTDGVCVDKVSGTSVYNKDATAAACGAYLRRNTGDKQWDKCPDCTMKVIGNLNVCHSDGKHIGGDELNYYCKQNKAGASLAS
ncbi:hypothetical protein BKA66DRAFT_589802 [Pyrenochaeta sp. MPI-SDFR-AT-0127]|nr:hypothetical protein BKA66DRAFT_589802 [Pyrenochaeta sp. MPI-SDFR-AT-0127]